MKDHLQLSRRQFLRVSMAGAVGAVALPTIVPSSVFGQNAPSKKIHVAHIGCGRIAHEMDLPGIIKHDLARYVAVCDLDSKRLANAKEYIEAHYAKQTGSEKAMAVKTYGDYREMLKDPAIDAVAISTPDHWHSEPVIATALAGKDVYVQKPLSMTLVEGRAVSDTLRLKARAFQIGSQQRSDAPWPQFRRACELVRNGRVGKLHTVQIGLPTDPSGGNETPMPVPPNLNYDMWLGCTPVVPYTEERVHPQNDFSRPGWLRIESYCLGMITGWGSHHVDIAHWGMDTELTGPIEAEAKAEFPRKGLWNVHGPYHIEMKYANGVTMIIDNKFPNGVRFEGSDGWVFVSRGSAKATASDPTTGNSKAFAASSPKIMNSEIGPNEIHLYKSEDHHLDWLKSIQSRKPCATTPEKAHRSTSACEIGWIAMKLGRKLRWDPVKEVFANDDEANAMRSRPQRAPYGTDCALKKA
ncbi:MAG TPA: Gfo/Idh/MocA family oxidoreductase [Candidatus Binatia bacterium]|jgi:myo-inositol 2-dehydrogenase/D-chiro-inositol 1-dehydrogenase|nr:Gfo/Idh/MocA family oxidoreductase [Candidatus Binatia bacterium]